MEDSNGRLNRKVQNASESKRFPARRDSKRSLRSESLFLRQIKPCLNPCGLSGVLFYVLYIGDSNGRSNRKEQNASESKRFPARRDSKHSLRSESLFLRQKYHTHFRVWYFLLKKGVRTLTLVISSREHCESKTSQRRKKACADLSR